VHSGGACGGDHLAAVGCYVAKSDYTLHVSPFADQVGLVIAPTSSARPCSHMRCQGFP
jgi:hypothetical protein